MSARARAPKQDFDPTIYPFSDDTMGEASFQRFIAELLRPLLARFLAERGVRAFVGADQFIYYKRHDTTKCLVPDVYVIPNRDPDEDVESWNTLDVGTPSFCLEIVTGGWRKDYEGSPRRYAEMGRTELVVFDRNAHKHENRVRFRVFRPVRGRGFVCVEATNADRVRSKALGVWVRAVGKGKLVRLRLGVGPRGDELFPTEAEAERAALEAERAALEALRRENAELRAKLARATPRVRRA